MKKVLFVGSFKTVGASGNVGGQMFACKTIIDSSNDLDVEWFKIDSTASTNKKRSFLERLYFGLMRFIKFYYYLFTKKVDHVLVFTSSGLGFYEKGVFVLSGALFGKRTIIAPRSGFIIDDVNKSIVFKNFAKLIFNKADYVVCQGTFWIDFFKNKLEVSSHKLRLIHNWVASPNGYEHKNDIKQLELMFLGWVEENKGIFDIIEAARQTKDLDLIWNICGNGKSMDDIRILILKYKLQQNVIIHNWVLGEKKKAMLNRCSVLLIPSYREGLPNALLEGMSQGLVPISTRVGAIPDVVNEENGFLVDINDPDAIASAVRKLHNDRNKLLEMSLAAYETIINNHTPDIGVKKFLQLFK